MASNTDSLKRLKDFYGTSVLALRVSVLTNLVLLAAVGFLAFSLYTIKNQVGNWKPLVIRVDEVGKAEPVDLVVSNNPPTELEVKVFCAEFVERTQSYDPNSMNKDIGLALACADGTFGKELIHYYQTNPDFLKLRQSGAVVQCKVKSVQILRTDPVEVRVDYTLTNLLNNETRQWYALLTGHKADRSFNNPFGLIVTGMRINTTLE